MPRLCCGVAAANRFAVLLVGVARVVVVRAGLTMLQLVLALGARFLRSSTRLAASLDETLARVSVGRSVALLARTAQRPRGSRAVAIALLVRAPSRVAVLRTLA